MEIQKFAFEETLWVQRIKTKIRLGVKHYSKREMTMQQRTILSSNQDECRLLQNRYIKKPHSNLIGDFSTRVFRTIFLIKVEHCWFKRFKSIFRPVKNYCFMEGPSKKAILLSLRNRPPSREEVFWVENMFQRSRNKPCGSETNQSKPEAKSFRFRQVSFFF